MFRARHEGDFRTLRVLCSQFIRVENYPAALLCLDPTFISTIPPHGNSALVSGQELSLHLSYFELLDRLRRGESLDPGSIRQKVFAFQPRENDRFFLPANGFLHAVFAPRPETLQEKDGCVITHEELRGVLDREILEFIRLRAKLQHNAYRRRLGADPCMAMFTRGECSKQDCQYQHIRPERMTVGWFNDRVRSVLTEIRILNLAGFHPTGVIVFVLLFTIIAPSSDFVRTGTGSVSFTIFCTLRHRSSGPSRRSISGTHLNQRSGSGFYGSGSGRRVTGFCLAPQLFRSSTSKPLSPSLCLFVRWRTTSTTNGHKDISLARGCANGTSGRSASFG